MNFGAETVGFHPLPLEDWGYERLQTNNNSIETGPIFPLTTSFDSASIPFPISPPRSQVSVTSSQCSCLCHTASLGLGPQTTLCIQKECNAHRPSDKAHGQPQGTENQARINSCSSSPQPQFRKESKELKLARRGQERPRDRKSRFRKRLRDEKIKAAKLNRRARKYARREARAAGIGKEQRLWLEARWKRAGKHYSPPVPFQPPVLYKPAGTGAKSAPGQRLVIGPRLLPLRAMSETDDDDCYNDSEWSDEDKMQERLNLFDDDEPMWAAPDGKEHESPSEPRGIVPEQDLEYSYNESQHGRVDDSYDLRNESGLDSGLDSNEETEEEDWSNIDPKTLLPPGIEANSEEETASGAPSLQMPVNTTVEKYFDCESMASE